MANVDTKLTESVIKQIMEGADPRVAIDAALDEKAGFHKEKRIRGGKAQVVNVKNSKRKVHHTLTADQKKAIKKAHSAQANKKRAKSLKKGAKMGLYKEDIDLQAQVMEAETDVEVEAPAEVAAEVAGLVLSCPACAEGSLEIVDGEGEDLVLVCPACGETFVICSTSEIEEDDDDDDDDDKDDAAEEEAPAEPAEDEAPQDESCEIPETCDDENCDGEACDGEECAPECESGLFFAAEE